MPAFSVREWSPGVELVREVQGGYPMLFTASGFQRVDRCRRRAGSLGRTGYVVIVSVCIVFKVHILVVLILFIFAVFIRASCCRRW